METASSAKNTKAKSPRRRADTSTKATHWLVCHAPVDKGPLGTLFIESRRHFLDFAEANDEELAAYGPLLKKVYAALKSRDGGGTRVSNRIFGGHRSFPCLAGPAQGR